MLFRALTEDTDETDPSGLERAVRRNPNDSIAKLVLADWLDEIGDPMDGLRAAVLRHRAMPDVFPHPFDELLKKWNLSSPSSSTP